MESHTFYLLSRGRAAARVKEKAEARRYLERMLTLDPPLEERLEGLYWLSEVVDDPKEARGMLEEILANNLGDARARRKLAILDGKLKPDQIIDPDRLPAPAASDGSQNAVVRSFTCPKCGGRMSYAPDGETLMCEYCELQQQIGPQTAAASEDDFLVAMATARAQHRPTAVQTVTCGGCGAIFVLPSEQISHTCPYCAAAYTVEQMQVREMDTPDGIIPFSLDESGVREAVKRWFLEDPPDGRPRLARGSGIYLPAWLFSLGGQIAWRGEINRNKGTLPVSGTRVVGQYDRVVSATTHLEDELLPVLDGFDLKGVRPYDPRYLANWLAETFQVTAAAASLQARQAALQQERLRIVEGELQAVNNLQVDSHGLLVEGYRLVLLPIWRSYYLLDEQRVEIAVNGQTGAVTARRPGRGLMGFFKDLF